MKENKEQPDFIEKFQFCIPLGEVMTVVNESLQKKSKTVSLKGFRPGKTPEELIRKMFYEQTFETVTREQILKRLEDHRKSNFLSCVIPLDVFYEVMDQEVKCFLEILTLPRVEIEKFEQNLGTEEVPIELLQIDNIDELSEKTLEAIKEIQLTVLEEGPTCVSTDTAVLVKDLGGKIKDTMLFNFSFDQETQEFVNSISGQSVGARIRIQLDGHEFPFEIAGIFAKRIRSDAGDKTELPSKEKIQDILKTQVDMANNERKFRRLEELIYKLCFSDLYSQRLKIITHVTAERNIPWDASFGAIDSMFFGSIFEQLGLTLSDNDVRDQVVDFCRGFKLNPETLSDSQWSGLLSISKGLARKRKVLSNYLNKARFQINWKSCSLKEALSLMEISNSVFSLDALKNLIQVFYPPEIKNGSDRS
ncbi:MAG: trigger factor family protein [Deltaproteobacteria bacterium]|nr:trigger factor family protein [Deltaproteobacteria bacterium]